MSQWTITIAAASGQAEAASGNTPLTGGNAPPGDFDGATINSITISGSPTISGEGTDDTIGVRWWVETSGGTDVYGNNASDAGSLMFANATGTSTSGSIARGGSSSPAPTTAVAADWDQVTYLVTYGQSGMPDNEVTGWSAFDIVVDYTASANVTRDPPAGSMSITPLLPSVSITQNVFATPPAGSLTLTGLEPFRAYGLLLTGYEPTVQIQAGTNQITPPVGSLSIAGLTPGVQVTENRYITVPVGAVSIAGQTPSVSAGDNINITVPTQSLSISGNAPVLHSGIQLPARTNVALRSQELDNAAWGGLQASVSPDATAAPDGTTTADKIVEDSASGVAHFVYTTASFSVDDSSLPEYTMSVYLKAGERTWARLREGDINTAEAWFDLENGSVGTVQGTGSPSASIEPSAYGFYRCSLTWTPSGTSARMRIFLATGNGSNSYAGDGSSGIYAWGVQVEAGAVATDYIPTTSAAASAVTGLSLWTHTPSYEVGNNISIGVPAGSLSVSGQAPSLGFAITVPTASLTITGATPSAGIGVNAFPPVQSLTLAGQAPLLDANIRAPPGSLSLSGQAPALDYSITIPATSLSLSGLSPALDLGLSPANDALTLTGLLPSVEATVSIEVPTGAILISGLTPSVDTTADGAIIPPVASLSISGLLPSVSVTNNVAITPPAGSLTLTGLEPFRAYGLLLRGYEPTVELATGTNQIIPPAGSLSITGLLPSISVTNNVAITPPAGSLSLSGLLPALSFEYFVTPPVQALSLVGYTPSVDVTVSGAIIPPVGSLSLSGLTPSVSATSSFEIVPDSGLLSIAGQSPILDSGITPPVGSISLSGLVVSLDSGIAPPVGAITLSGLIPTPGLTGKVYVDPDSGSITITGQNPSVSVTGLGTISRVIELTAIFDPGIALTATFDPGITVPAKGDPTS